MFNPTLVSSAVPPMFEYLAREDFKNKPFVILGARQLTYGGLWDFTQRAARFFRQSGIDSGDRVVICSQLEIETIAIYLAAMRAGVTAVLIDPHSAHDEVHRLVQAAQAKCLFIDKARADETSFHDDLLPGGRIVKLEINPSDPGLPHFLQDLEPLTPPSGIPGDTSAFILFTSGTTSKPKGVEVTHGAFTAHLETMHRQYGYGPESVLLNGLPLHHSDGINHGAVNALAAGATLVRTGPFAVQRLPEIMQLVAQHHVTHMITVPTVLALIWRFKDEFPNPFRDAHFKFISSTAGPLDERLWLDFEAHFGSMIVNSYGLTETICEGFYCGPTPQTRRIGTIGKPIDIDVRLVDPNAIDVAPGEMGEIVLRGDCLMKGYFNAPEETASVLRDGWFHTGDLAVMDADGFFRVTGRKKNVVITGGLNVYPEDVSRTISRLPGVADVVTVGVPDEIWGERVVSCVVRAPGASLSEDEVIAICRDHLSPEKVPSQIFIVAELPRGPAGKIALPQVKQLVAERLQAAAAHGERSPAEVPSGIARRVLGLAARIFKTPVAELTADSEPETTAGWNSLAHMEFIVTIEAEFGISVAPADMLSIVTLGDAIEFIERSTK